MLKFYLESSRPRGISSSTDKRLFVNKNFHKFWKFFLLKRLKMSIFFKIKFSKKDSTGGASEHTYSYSGLVLNHTPTNLTNLSNLQVSHSSPENRLQTLVYAELSRSQYLHSLARRQYFKTFDDFRKGDQKFRHRRN